MRVAPFLCLTPVLFACGDETVSPNPVQVTFSASIGAASPVCGQTYADLGSDRDPFTLRDLRFYVSELEVGGQSVTLDDDGTWQDGQVALLDFETGGSECELGTAATRDVVVGTVDGDVGTGLAFTVGVPFDMNHLDASIATGPLSLTSMFWNWRGGYKFIRVDGRTGDKAFNVHLGSTGCDGDAAMGGTTNCANPNRIRVELADWNPDTSVVSLDLARMFEGVSLSQSSTVPAAGCQSFPNDGDCPAVFDNLGLPYAGTPASGAQTVFTLGSRG